MKKHEDWWERNLPNHEQMDIGEMGKTFRGWLRGINAESRLVFRDMLINNKYKSMLDCAAGLCDEYYGIKNNGINIKYSAIDITPKLVKYNFNKGIDIKESSIENILYPDNSFELCYGRHILEHLDYYENALSEMIRVAYKAVIVTFFRAPGAEETMDYLEKEQLYQNIYNQSKMDKFILENKKVASLEWKQPVILKHKRWNTGEVILYIVLR